MTVTDYDTRSAYLDLLRQDLTRYGVDELVPVGWNWLHRPFFKFGDYVLVRKRAFDAHKRDLGLDWPADALTMIGMQRLTSLQQCSRRYLPMTCRETWSNVASGVVVRPS